MTKDSKVFIYGNTNPTLEQRKKMLRDADAGALMWAWQRVEGCFDPLDLDGESDYDLVKNELMMRLKVYDDVKLAMLRTTIEG